MTELIRPPAVAGSFYPAEPAELNALMQDLFFAPPAEEQQPTAANDTAKDKEIQSLKAIIAPHAGYVYSGPIAANAYRCLYSLHDQFNRVVLLGPSHRVALRGLALSSARTYLTPLGEIPLDLDCIERLQGLDNVRVNDEAHRYEHSLEVHLPFLQATLDNFSLVPLVVGDTDPHSVSRVLDQFTNEKHTLIVISTDLSHFHDYATAKRRDLLTSEAILNFDYNGIGYGDACGRNPVNGALYWAKQHHYAIKLIDLRNSGDTAGDKSRVVGYAAFHIYSSC